MILLPAVKRPDWKDHTPPHDFGDVLPKDRFGLPITWTEKIAPTPVFLEQYVIGPNAHDAYLIGLRFDTSKMLLKGRPGSDGFFLQFLVVEFESTDRAVLHMLRQHRSPIYSAANDGKDWLWASEVKKADKKKLLLVSPPTWEETEAQWPTASGKLMHFVGQVSLPENDVTRVHLTWDKRLFLFLQRGAGSSAFKIFAQDCNLQTAEEHYARE